MRSATFNLRASCAGMASALLVGLFALTFANAQTNDEIVNSLGMRFALVPRASFSMGSPAEEPFRRDDETLHDVRLTKSFYMGLYEVTQRQYSQVMGTNPSFFSATGPGKGRIREKEAPLHPVESVTWDQAIEFCKKLSDRPEEKARGFRYRLPTEAEWEWACRAGTATPLYFGRDATSDDANFNGVAPFGHGRMGTFLRSTSVMGAYRANAFGLCDMHGNVAEWCADWYDAETYKNGEKVDPRGPEKGTDRVIRGGGWANTARECRSAARNHLPPDTASYNVGFRVVLERNER